MPLDAIVLLGWMERDFAISYLVNDCVFDPALTPETAQALWQEYRARVDALPERKATAPGRLPLTMEEQGHAEEFLKFHHKHFHNNSVLDVIKVDPMGLVTYQFYINLDRANVYMQHATARSWCAKNCLNTVRNQHALKINHAVNAANVEIPHGEYIFIYNDQLQKFDIIEQARHVSVTAYQDRMVLWAGYHRSYARMASVKPDGIDRSLLVALTTDADFFVSPASPNQGLRALLCGLRPPLFADFFDERFVMKVKLRKKRFELQIRAQVAGVNID